MRQFLFAAVAAAGLSLVGVASLQAAQSEGSSKGKEVKGVLIDNKCGAGQESEETAAKHPTACAIKCAGTGYQIVSGKEHLKFDEKGNELAKKYLASADKSDKEATRVVVMGTPSEDGKTIKVTSIKAAKEAEKKEEKKDS